MGYGCDGGFVTVEEAPCLASFVDDVVIAAEDGVGELVATQVFPDVFNAVEFGRIAWQADEGDVGGDTQTPAAVIARTIKDHGGVSLRINGFADGLKMQAHHCRIGLRCDDGSGDSATWAGSTEQVGPVVALITRRAGP